MLASWIALSRRLAGVHALAGEVHDHDAVLLDDAHQHEHADEGVERRLLPEDEERQEPADERRRQRREDRQRVDVALVEDRQDDVHDEHGEDHQDRQVADGVLERQGLALQARAQRRRHDLRRGLRDVIGRVPDRDARLQVERRS